MKGKFYLILGYLVRSNVHQLSVKAPTNNQKTISSGYSQLTTDFTGIWARLVEIECYKIHTTDGVVKYVCKPFLISLWLKKVL